MEESPNQIVQVRMAVTGSLVLELADSNVADTYIRSIKLQVARISQVSPFALRLMSEADILDDFWQVKDCVFMRRLNISVIVRDTHMPNRRQYDMLAESIGNNYGQHVWQILAQGIRLPTCLPMRRTATMNALVLALQSLYLEFEEDERYPSVLQSLLLAACNPNDFGHPPRVPLIEATKRCDQEAIQLLVSHRADVNRTTRGEDYPLIIAIKHHQATIVQCLLECRADPTVRTYYNTQQRTGIAVWSGLSAQQLTYPGTTVARLIEDAAAQWPRVTPSHVD